VGVLPGEERTLQVANAHSRFPFDNAAASITEFPCRAALTEDYRYGEKEWGEEMDAEAFTSITTSLRPSLKMREEADKLLLEISFEKKYILVDACIYI